MNLVPGATPPVFQNAQTDTPGRALSTNINGTNRNNNVTRIDGAASINVWLPHHVGYIAPAETIENVNVSTNSFDAAQGMTGWRRHDRPDQVGHQQLQGLDVLLPEPGRAQRPPRVFRPDQARLQRLDHGRHGRRSHPAQQAVLLRRVGTQRRAQRPLRSGDGADREDAERGLQRSARELPELPALRPRDGQRRTGAGRTLFEGAIIPANRISSISRDIQDLYPAPNTAGTNFGLQNNAFIARSPKAIRDNYDVKVNWNRTSAHQIWGKASMMDASVQDLFYLGLDNAGGGDTTVTIFTVGSTWTLSPTLLLDGNVGSNKMVHQSSGPDYGTNYGLEDFGIPGMNSAGVTGPGSTDLERYSGLPVFNTGMSALGNTADLDAGVAQGGELHGLGQPHEGPGAP